MKLHVALNNALKIYKDFSRVWRGSFIGMKTQAYCATPN